MHDPGSELAREWMACAEADELTPYAVEFHYPDALPLVPFEAAQAAVETADQIYDFIAERVT